MATSTESMTELERTLRETNGINIFLHRKLIDAYQSEDGAVTLPALIEANPQLINPELLPRLRELAADLTQ